MPAGRRYPTRRRATLAGLALTSTMLVPLAALPTAPAAANTAAPSCAAPALREAMVSQGLPSYRALARGKQTLVKLFLSQKQGCSAKITVKGGTLRVAAGSTPVQNVALGNAQTLVQLPSYEVAAADASNSDPYFVVPGTVLSPGALPELPYTATFSGELDYESVHNGTTYSQKLLFDKVNGVAITETVERPAKPLRILVVPMGDAIKGYSSVFPGSAGTALSTGMQGMHRVLPVADGIGTVESRSGGLRYTVAPSQQLVNLGLHEEKNLTGTKTVTYLNSSGLFCGKESSFVYIQQKLAEARNAWNSVHDAAQDVDRVLGVVAQENSVGPTTNDGLECAEGYAGVNAPEAWFRLVRASAEPTPRHLAGFLATMEIGHTIGAVPLVRGTRDYHSPNDQADGTAPERAYNIMRREYRADDRSTMTFGSSGWHDDNTFLEAADWDLAQCVLVTGTDTSATCAGSEAVVGGTTGAAGVLHAAGRTDGTPGGTNLHTYVLSQQQYERTRAPGPYYVRFFLSGLYVREQAVPVHFTHSHHSGGNSGGTSGAGIFDIALDAAGADSFQFVRRDPTTGLNTVLFSRMVDGRPQITQVRRASTSTRSAYVATPADEVGAALSPDGRYVVWGQEDGLRIRRTTDTAGPDTFIPDAYQAAWSHRGDQLAASYAGGIMLLDLDTSAASGPPPVTDRRMLYQPRVVGDTTVDSALHASWSPDDSRLAVVLDRTSIAELDTRVESANCSDMVGCRLLIPENGNEMDWTAWSPALPDAPDGLIAYERSNTDFPEKVLYTIDPAREIVQTRRLPGTQPAWGGGRLAYVDERGVATVSDTTFDGERRVESVPGDFWPSLTRDGSIVAYTGAGQVGSGRDIYLVRTSSERTEVVVSDDRPDDLRLDVFLVCAGSAAPVVTGLYPRRSGSESVFDVTLDPSAACPDATPLYRATDGFQTASQNDDVVLPGRTAPVVAVASPRSSDAFNEHAPVPVDLDGWAPDGARLPVTYTVSGPLSSHSFTSSAAETADITSYLAPGSYTLTAQVTHRGATSTQVVPFTVRADNDRDGLPNTADRQDVHSCYPVNAHLTAENAVTDYDGDLLIGLSDPEPCKSAFNATVAFEPQTVQIGSSGTQLTFTISSRLESSKVTVPLTHITRMAGHPVSLRAVSVAVVDNKTVTVKFDRQAYSDLAKSLGLTSGYVPVVVTLVTSSGTALGADARYPIHKS